MNSSNTFFVGISEIPLLPDFSKGTYNQIVDLPDNVTIQDFTAGMIGEKEDDLFYIGRYNEKRLNMYTGDHFEKNNRCIHMGIDIGAPVGTKVKSFTAGEIFLFGYNEKTLDYGYTIITKHIIDDCIVFALYGHLNRESITEKKSGEPVFRGQALGEIGNEDENGGWPPHVHFQLSLIAPKTYDLPGVVSEKDWGLAQKIFPDPRLVQGQLY